eukprot:m.1606780 g.1606780  ORF g.1606780 m.1606780 type:complete len:601 (+) comp25361_c0_seq20:967-2769(+)
MLNRSFHEDCHVITVGTPGSPQTPSRSEEDGDDAWDERSGGGRYDNAASRPHSPSGYTDMFKRWYNNMTIDLSETSGELEPHGPDDDDDGSDYGSVDEAVDGGVEMSHITTGIDSRTVITSELGTAEVCGEISVADDTSLKVFQELFKCDCTRVNATGVFSAIILATWDNVMGPINKHVWCSPARPAPELYQQLLPFHPSCTLNGEISRENVGLETAEYKFYVLSELKHAMGTFIFTCAKTGNLFAISLVVPEEDLSVYLSIQELCLHRMRHLIKSLQELLKVDGEMGQQTMEGFTEMLVPFLTSISQIGIPAPMSESYDMNLTAFAPQHRDMFDDDFLAIAITSHLGSGGVSIVLGDDREVVNTMVYTLAGFLCDDECTRSRLVTSAGDDLCFAPDLILQGLVQDTIQPNAVMQSSRSSTVINTKTGVVLQANPLEHKVRHAEAEAKELLRLRMEKMRRESASSGPHGKNGAAADPTLQRHMMRDVRRKAPLVVALLDTLTTPGLALGVCQVLLNNFCVGIIRAAHVMIQYTLADLSSPGETLNMHAIKTIRKHTKLQNDSDYQIVLAAAEKLQSGIYWMHVGDPVAKEEQVLELLGAF